MTDYTTASSDWPIVKFGDVVRNPRDTSQDPLADGFERYVGVADLEPENLHIRSWGSIEEEDTSFSRVFRAGQVLFSKRRAYQRKAALADFDGICSGDLLVFEAIEEYLLPELLPFIVQSDGFYDHALATSAGSLSPRTKWRDLAVYEFALPPLDEQQRIAEILWAADEVVERGLFSIQELKTLKFSAMYALFNELSGLTVPLDQVGDWLSGGTPSKTRSDYWEGDIPWVSPKDMKSSVLSQTEDHITLEAAQNGSKLVPSQSILIVVRGMILDHTFPIAITDREMAFNQDMKALIAKSDFMPQFVFYWLQQNAPRILRLVSTSSHGTKKLSSDILFRLQIPKPTIEQQDHIVKVCRTFDENIAKLENHVQESARLKRGLLASFNI